MIIKKRRIKNLKANIGFIDVGTNIILGINDIGRFKLVLNKIGFTKDLEMGESVLPLPIGPISNFNANGGYIKHKNQPKESISYQREHTWTEWHGKKRVERTGYVDFTRERYPRTIIKPPSTELTISATSNGSKVLIAPNMEYNKANENRIKHVINLFLEFFRECNIYSENLDNIIKAPIKRLNWEVLPKGTMPWPQFHKKIIPMLKNTKPLIKPVIEWRLSTLYSYDPDFVAIGQAGFRGYIGFGFEDKDIYIFESIYRGNATYIFDENWKKLSKKTKAEILDDKLQKDRIIHRKGWKREINKLFK